MKRTGQERHHIYPKHRISHPTAIVKAPNHQLYHTIFGINTPKEVLDWLVNEIWGGKISILNDYIKGRCV